jgi:uncharacterized protein
VRALVTRTGVLTYTRTDGTVVRELRHPDHVFNPASLASLEGAPVTVGHPRDGGFVSPDNAHALEVGVVREAKRDGGFVDSRLSVRRADAIGRIDKRELVEVSAAYDMHVDKTPGVYEGEPYDQQQTDITYNHVALLPLGKGRAGRAVRLRLDANDAEIRDDDETDIEERDMSARRIRVDGIEYELPETAAGVLEKAIADRDKAALERTEEKRRADSVEAERDQLRISLAEAQDPKALSTRISARVDLEQKATRLLGSKGEPFEGLTDRQVHERVLTKVSPKFSLEGRSDDAVSAAFEYALGASGKENHGLREVGKALRAEPQHEQKRSDAAEENSIDAQLRELENARLSAWKKGRA